MMCVNTCSPKEPSSPLSKVCHEKFYMRVDEGLPEKRSMSWREGMVASLIYATSQLCGVFHMTSLSQFFVNYSHECKTTGFYNRII